MKSLVIIALIITATVKVIFGGVEASKGNIIDAQIRTELAIQEATQ